MAEGAKGKKRHRLDSLAIIETPNPQEEQCKEKRLKVESEKQQLELKEEMAELFDDLLEERKVKPKSGPTPGIVYLSRIPPFMTPKKVKQLLSECGDLGRVFLQPEDPTTRARRKKSGGNRKRNYTEGWVEFLDKRVAKGVAMHLNNTPIGGKKKNFYHDDLWNLKYLSKFRWTHLTEKTAYESAVRSQKVRTEVSQAKRENAFYLQNVDKGKALSSIKERKTKKAAEKGETSQGWVSKAQWNCKQREPRGSSQDHSFGQSPSSRSVSKELLGKIFTAAS